MATTDVRPELPLVVIVGPTASGKTALAIELAKKLNGEIICADSRTVYKDMDIGTAKPDTLEKREVPHWGIDLVEPNVRYNAGQFQLYANTKIAEIRKRGKIPFLVGGTGLYIDGVVFDYAFPKPFDESLRQELEGLSQRQLYEYCIKNNIELPENDKNKRHLIQAALHPEGIQQIRRGIRQHTIVVGIATEKRILSQRIAERTEHMFAHGVVDEATRLGKKYGWDAEAMTSNVYRVIKLHLEGKLSLTETKEKFTTRDRQLAKRQMTWFRRNPYIEWCNATEAKDYVFSRLATEYNL